MPSVCVRGTCYLHVRSQQGHGIVCYECYRLSLRRSKGEDSAEEGGKAEEKDEQEENANEIRSLEEELSNLNERASEEASSSVNAADIGDRNVVVGKSRSPNSSKSLVDIKARLSEIKARRQQLKLLEENKNASTSKGDDLIVTEIANI